MTPAELARLDALLPLLLDIAVAAHAALDDCQVDGPDGPILDASTHALLCKAMERLDELPDEPGYASTGPAKARYALHNAYPALREQLREMAAEIATLKRSYVPADRAGECLEVLDAAGMGKPDAPHGNTLIGMVKEIRDRLAAVTAERDAIARESLMNIAKLQAAESKNRRLSDFVINCAGEAFTREQIRLEASLILGAARAASEGNEGKGANGG